MSKCMEIYEFVDLFVHVNCTSVSKSFDADDCTCVCLIDRLIGR